MLARLKLSYFDFCMSKARPPQSNITNEHRTNYIGIWLRSLETFDHAHCEFMVFANDWLCKECYVKKRAVPFNPSISTVRKPVSKENQGVTSL